MSEYLGLQSLHQDLLIIPSHEGRKSEREAHLKRNALLFDKIGLLHSDFVTDEKSEMHRSTWKLDPEWASNINWLIERQVLFPLFSEFNPQFIKSSSPELEIYISEIKKFDPKELEKKVEIAFEQIDNKFRAQETELKKIKRGLKRNINIKKSAKKLELLEKEFQKAPQVAQEILDKQLRSWIQFESNILRMKAMEMESLNKVTAIPLLSLSDYLVDIPTGTKTDVVEIVIRNLPLPSSTTPWEAIIDYRNDDDAQKSLRSLRNWMRKVSSKDLPVNEVEEELKSLMDEFDSHMRLHKLKADTEILQTILKAPLEMIENLLRIKPSKIIDPLFAFRKHHISLMEAELNAPGREIAYIIKTKETFWDVN